MPNNRLFRIPAMLVLVTAVLGSDFAAGPLSAQDDKRLFGGGRFLRRMRDEVDKAGEAVAKQLQGRDRRQPTLAERPADGRRQPTPATKRTNPLDLKRTPVPQRAAAGSLPPRTPQQDSARSLIPRLPSIANQRDISRLPKPPESKTDATPSRSDAKSTLGFGMMVQSRGEKLIVTQLDPRGNAREAGLRVGDEIVTGGGIKFGSIQEMNEIAAILKDGDQLEFEIQRRGDKQKVMIGFGEAPDAESVLETVNDNGQDRDDVRSQVNTKNNFSFLPASSSRTRSPNSVLAGSPSPKQAGSNQFQPSPQRPAAALQETIRRQQLEIERLRQQLRRAGDSAAGGVIGSGTTNFNDGPALSGPGR